MTSNLILLNNSEVDARQLSPLTLAFLGDAVFGLLTRERLVSEADRPVGRLHELSIKYVSADAQYGAVKEIMDSLSDEEVSVFKRGRNAHTGRKPKHSTDAAYHYATGLETLFGYLYLEKRAERISELFDKIYNIINDSGKGNITL